MTKLSAKPHETRPRKKHPLSRFFEFKGINRLTIGQYRTSIRNLYDGPAGAVLALGSMISLHEPLVGHLLRSRKFDVTGHQTILDVGSGAGQILRHLLRRTQSSAQLVGFDLSHQMLIRARKKLKSHRPAYVAGDLMRMPFAEESFDCVTCGWVIEHLPDPKPGLMEIGRVLKPGGRALILATEDTVLGSLVSRTWKCRTYNRKELELACGECGVPWKEQLYFTKAHRFFKMGGILVEAVKSEA
jgi:SAM-dependent methyltransferase